MDETQGHFKASHWRRSLLAVSPHEELVTVGAKIILSVQWIPYAFTDDLVQELIQSLWQSIQDGLDDVDNHSRRSPFTLREPMFTLVTNI